MKNFIFSAIFLLAFSIQNIKTDCSCYQSTPYTGKSAPLSNAYDPNNFDSCYSTPCSYTAYSGDDTFGWTNLTVRWGTPLADANGVIKIFDGSDSTGTPIIQINEGEDVLEGDPRYLTKSSTPRITIVYSQDSNGKFNSYYGSIKAGPGLQSTAAPTTTIIPQTTVSYDNNLYSNDPSSITHDIMVVVNKKTSGGAQALSKVNAIIGNFVSILPCDGTKTSRTRLSLATLTPYDTYYSIQGGIWELTPYTLNQSLTLSGISIEGNIDLALIGLVDLAFNVNTNSPTDSRANVQRSVLLSSGATLNETVQNKFDDFGVNLLVVGYNLDNNDTTTILNPNRWFNAINTVDSSPAFTAEIVNPYYFNDKSSVNYWCPPTSVKNYIGKSGANVAFFSEPMNYAGPNGTAGNSDWSMLRPYYGQTARYCNFANNLYIYQKPDNIAIVKVTVFYELEAGKDLLSFYDINNNLLASFTGYDIAGSSFHSTSSILTAKFTSDNQSIYRGFYVEISPVST